MKNDVGSDSMNFIDILFVDDHEIMRFVVQKHLESVFKIQTLESGKELYRCLDTFRPKVLILDLMMPGMSGFDILKELRKNPAYGDLIIIVLTAKGSKDDAIECLNLGANDFMTKPPHYPEFIARIKTLLRQKEAEQSIRLESQMDAYRSLVSGLRHEYNNIFGTLRLFIQMVDWNGIEYFREKMKPVLDSIQRGLSLMDSFNQFFVSELQNPKKISLSETIETALAKKSLDRVNLSLDIHSFDISLMGNQDRLAQAIFNLIDNAVHAVANTSDPQIAIRTEAVSDGYCLRIRDNGCGIEPGKVSKLGDIFFTTKGALGGSVHDNKTTGTGLGIPISHQILRLHGAKLEIQSVLGKGTQITVHFPQSILLD